MKLSNKLLAVLLSAVMMTSMLTGCSSKQESNSDTESQSSQTEVTEGNAEAAETSEVNDVEWPGNKTVQIIVPYSAGGDTDFNARVLAEKLSEKTGGNFVVVNVNGNGGATGSLQAMSSDPDGNTILFHNVGLLINQVVGVSDFGIEAFDFCAITGLNPGQVFAVLASKGINSLDELKAYTEEHPGELTISANTGGSTHVDSLMLLENGFDVTMVDAGSGSERVSALLGGHVDIIINSYGTIKDYIETGEIIPLALDALEDSDKIDIPTAISEGYDVGLRFNYFTAFPKGTDPAIVAKCSSILKAIILEDEDYAAQIDEAYKQTPCYYDTEEGLEILNQTYEDLSALDFSQ